MHITKPYDVIREKTIEKKRVRQREGNRETDRKAKKE